MIQEIRIAQKKDDDRGRVLLQEIKRTLNINSIEKIRTAKLYRFEGIDYNTAKMIAQKTLVDSLCESYSCNEPFCFSAHTILEVGNKPGVMNPEIASISKAVAALGINSLVATQTSWEYHFCGKLAQEQLELICDRLLVNKTIARVITQPPTTLQIQGCAGDVASIPLSTMSHSQFAAYAQKHQLYLSSAECAEIMSHFKKLGRDPFDAELETIAQTWSEHCSHKTFRAPLMIDGKHKEPLYSRLKKTAKKYDAHTLSAFEDNAGVFKFYDGYAIAAKVETHNSPSAIEPYGGAATGSGGVFRDIMGTGKGAQVIASTDIFCFAAPTLKAHEIPAGCLHPDYVLRNVVAGVRDYGNRMGIPTNNGSVHFHPDFRAKPTVIVGAYGIMPEKECAKGVPKIHDRIFTVGGKTGRDGIHGATFSSDSMTDQTINVNATAVQIGNPIEQKRMADALIAARDKNLLHAITDCGAGGFSSAVGEMAKELGARIELSHAPLKYSGLAPWEIWISESQERMVCAVAPANADEFIKLCALYNVDATDIGYFTGKKKLLVEYAQQTVCDLDMQFLHEGCPIPLLQATAPTHKKLNSVKYQTPQSEHAWDTLFKKIMAHGNVCSKEPIVRQYDHTVQGMNVIPPYAGIQDDAPQNSAVLAPLYGKKYGLIIAHGLNPLLNRIDPYAGSVWAITEAVSNLVAVGGNPRDAILIDNFIWPKPQHEHLWALDRAMDACVDGMDAFKIPFISGKDSLSSTYKFADGSALHIPPVLCVSVVGKIPDITKTVTSDIKHTDSLLVLIGNPDFNAMGGSVYEQTLDITTNAVPKIDMQKTAHMLDTLHTLIAENKILACHDISEGGIAAAIAEMCFGGKKGAQLDLHLLDYRLDHILFNETSGCFIAEVSRDQYENNFATIQHTLVGSTIDEYALKIKNTFEISLDDLHAAWQKPMKEIFQ